MLHLLPVLELLHHGVESLLKQQDLPGGSRGERKDLPLLFCNAFAGPGKLMQGAGKGVGGEDGHLHGEHQADNAHHQHMALLKEDLPLHAGGVKAQHQHRPLPGGKRHRKRTLG